VLDKADLHASQYIELASDICDNVRAVPTFILQVFIVTPPPFQTLPRGEQPFRNIENIDSKFILWKSSYSQSGGVKPGVGNTGSDSSPSYLNDAHQKGKSTGLYYLPVILHLLM
jgi:hypothetical protein